MPDHSARAVAMPRDGSLRDWRYWACGLALSVGAGLAADRLVAQDADTIVSHGYSNFGDLRYGPEDVLDYVNPDAPKGGEFSLWSQGSFDSFNPYAREGTTVTLATLPYESVLISTADDPYGLYCYLCETMEYPESLDWAIFTMRQDVTFADGTPMTAEDVAFTFNLFQEQGIAEYRNVVSQFISEVEVLDEYRVKFTFTEDAPRRDVIGFAGGTSVFSKAWFEETDARIDEVAKEPFMGTGPYVLDEVDWNRRVVYARDPDWWGTGHPINTGRSNFDEIRVEYFADSSAAFEGFKSGAYTFRNENSSLQWATGYEFPAVENGWVVTAELPDGTIGTGQGFVFNLDREKWQDNRVRQAISMMVNFEWMNESLFYGIYDRPTSFWDNSDLRAEGMPSEGEIAILQPLVDAGLFPETILTEPAVMPYVSETTERPLDRGLLRRASALLDEAGWIAGEDGIRRKDGEPLTVVFLQFSPQFDRIVNPVIENLERLGVQATLERVDTSQYIERRRSGAFDLVNHSLGQGYEPGTGLRQWFGSETADDSSRNLMRLRSEGIDRLLDTVIAAESLEELTTATRALDRALRAEGFWIPQWQKNTHTIAYYDMYRYPEPLPPLALGELDFWWYDAEAAAELEAAGAFQ